MSIEKKSKDHRNELGSVAIVSSEPLKANDLLQFWTNHPTENTLVDLHSFADGELTKPLYLGPSSWQGPFTGRPTLIAELAPAIESNCVMRGSGTVTSIFGALRAWWRLFDLIEQAPAPGGHPIAKVVSIVDLGPHHEAAAVRSGISSNNFRNFLRIVNSARTLQRLPKLGWITPGSGDPIRHLIPEDQAREIKVALKQDWEQVR